MIDLATETLLTLEQAAEKLLVAKCTVYRWITSGSGGVRLEAIKFGGHWRTSEEAHQRFGDRLTPSQDTTSAVTPVAMPPVLTPSFPQRDLKQIKEELDQIFGIKKCETCRKVIEAKNVVIPKNERVWCPDCIVKRKSASLGQRLRMFRWAASLSQQMLSADTGIGVDKIRAYESDDSVPPDDHLEKLKEILGTQLTNGLEEKSKGDSESQRKRTGS